MTGAAALLRQLGPDLAFQLHLMHWKGSVQAGSVRMVWTDPPLVHMVNKSVPPRLVRMAH